MWLSIESGTWQRREFINQFIHAINERNHVTSGSVDYTVPITTGQSIQQASFYRGLQGAIESFAISEDFVVSHVSGIEVTNYDGQSNIPTYSSLSGLFSAAGCSHYDWRRYTQHPDDGGILNSGQMQTGDIIGDWVFEDLQKTLSVLVWELHDSTWTLPGNYGANWISCLSRNNNTYADGQASVAANWPQSSGTSSVSPTAWTWVSHESDDTFDCQAERRVQKQAVQFYNGDGPTISGMVDWYIWPTGRTNGYSDQGEGWIENKYNLWSTDSVCFSGGIGTSYLSSTVAGASLDTQPNDWPSDPGLGNDYESGWEATGNSSNRKCIIRFDVTNGFKYF